VPNHLAEVFSGTDGIDVEKDMIAPEVRDERVTQSASILQAVYAPIADKDSYHEVFPASLSYQRDYAMFL
jgi:hypothetical protein